MSDVKLKSIAQLIQEGYLVPSKEDSNYLEQNHFNIDIKYAKTDEILVAVTIDDEDSTIVDFSTSCGTERLHEFDCNINDNLFRVLQ